MEERALRKSLARRSHLTAYVGALSQAGGLAGRDEQRVGAEKLTELLGDPVPLERIAAGIVH